MQYSMPESHYLVTLRKSNEGSLTITVAPEYRPDREATFAIRSDENPFFARNQTLTVSDGLLTTANITDSGKVDDILVKAAETVATLAQIGTHGISGRPGIKSAPEGARAEMSIVLGLDPTPEELEELIKQIPSETTFTVAAGESIERGIPNERGAFTLRFTAPSSSKRVKKEDIRNATRMLGEHLAHEKSIPGADQVVYDGIFARTLTHGNSTFSLNLKGSALKALRKSIDPARIKGLQSQNGINQAQIKRDEHKLARVKKLEELDDTEFEQTMTDLEGHKVHLATLADTESVVQTAAQTASTALLSFKPGDDKDKPLAAGRTQLDRVKEELANLEDANNEALKAYAAADQALEAFRDDDSKANAAASSLSTLSLTFGKALAATRASVQSKINAGRTRANADRDEIYKLMETRNQTETIQQVQMQLVQENNTKIQKLDARLAARYPAEFKILGGQKRLELIDESYAVLLPLRRSAFGESTHNLTLTNGVITNQTLVQPSEALEIVSTPLKVIDAVLAVPADFFATILGNQDAELKVLRKEVELLQAEQNLQRVADEIKKGQTPDPQGQTNPDNQ